MTLILGFVLHAVAIFVGARLARLERIDFWRAAVVALLSYIVIALVSIALWPFSLVPLVGALASSLALGIGTAVTARFVLNCNWQPAAVIGMAVMVMGALSGWLLMPFR